MFTQGFCKTAKSEHEEYEKASAVDRVMSKFPHPEKAKPGDRVAYYSSDRGWKEGPWASHTKGCSVDEEMGKKRKKYEAELKKKKDNPPHDCPNHPYNKFPLHHSGKDWDKEAVRMGDMGTVVEVEKGAFPRFSITWDKHPNCVWGGYEARKLKVPPKGM